VHAPHGRGRGPARLARGRTPGGGGRAPVRVLRGPRPVRQRPGPRLRGGAPRSGQTRHGAVGGAHRGGPASLIGISAIAEEADEGHDLSDALDEARRQRVIAPGRRLSNQMVVDDTGAILEFLRRSEPVRPGGIGAIGYCMGGRHVLCVAGHYPESVIASASLHGTSLISDATDSPHLLAKRFRGELYCGFAETDPYAPLSMVKELDELLRPCPVTYRYAIHVGARHGYSLTHPDNLHPRGAARDWEMIFAMFHGQIPPYKA